MNVKYVSSILIACQKVSLGIVRSITGGVLMGAVLPTLNPKNQQA